MYNIQKVEWMSVGLITKLATGLVLHPPDSLVSGQRLREGPDFVTPWGDTRSLVKVRAQ